jgi:hypothetical protein
MAIHVEQVTTDLAMFEGDLPLSDDQIRGIAARVAAHMKECKRDERERRDASKLDRGSVVPWAGGEA